MSARLKYGIGAILIVQALAIAVLFWLVLDLQVPSFRSDAKSTGVFVSGRGFVGPATATAIAGFRQDERLRQLEADVERLRRQTGADQVR